jgi:hypothetical protein
VLQATAEPGGSAVGLSPVALSKFAKSWMNRSASIDEPPDLIARTGSGSSGRVPLREAGLGPVEYSEEGDRERISSAQNFAATHILVVATWGCGGGGTARDTSSALEGPTRIKSTRCRETKLNGGTFTFPLTQMLANYNYNQLDGTLPRGIMCLRRYCRPLSTMMLSASRSGAETTWRQAKLTTDPKQVVTAKSIRRPPGMTAR